MLRWPDRDAVLHAARSWAAIAAPAHPGVIAIGCYGSYARGECGVGSDLDLVVIVERCEAPFERRALDWNVDDLPVPVDLLVYTTDEWNAIMVEAGRFGRMLRDDTVWLWREAFPSPPAEP